MSTEASADVASESSNWAALLEAARQGEAEAFGEVCERLRDYLLLTAEMTLGSDVQAKFGASDVVQRTFLDAHRDFARFVGGSEAEIKAWLVRLVKHNLIDAARQFCATEQRDVTREISLNAGESPRDVVGPQKTPSSIIRRRERDEALLRAVTSLPDRQRRIIELRHRDARSFAQIAAEMNITEPAARKLWSRTVQRLRKKLASEHATGTALS